MLVGAGAWDIVKRAEVASVLNGTINVRAREEMRDFTKRSQLALLLIYSSVSPSPFVGKPTLWRCGSLLLTTWILLKMRMGLRRFPYREVYWWGGYGNFYCPHYWLLATTRQALSDDDIIARLLAGLMMWIAKSVCYQCIALPGPYYRHLRQWPPQCTICRFPRRIPASRHFRQH